MGKQAVRRVASVLFLLLMCGLAGTPSAGEGGQGDLTRTQIEAWRAEFESGPHNMTMLNALTKNKMKDIAFNRQQWLLVGETFSSRIEAKGITDQKSTGRCWLFAGYNILRQRVRQKFDMEEFEFSESYGQFWDKLEKANLFLEEIIKTSDKDLMDRKVEWLFTNPFSDGGQWNMVVDLVDKYGVVPKEVMPETYNSSNSSGMNDIISQKLRKCAGNLRALAAAGNDVEAMRAEKEKILGEIYRMLAMNLGLPPGEFKWRPVDSKGKVGELKTYTPQSFYSDVVGTNLGEYYYFLDSPAHPYETLFQIDMDRDMVERPNLTFANLQVLELKAMALASLLDGEPVWLGCDVGKEHYRDEEMGLMDLGIIDYESVYGVDVRLTKEERIKYHDSIPNHAMAFIGVDVTDGKPVKWLVENSWGKDTGDEGLFTMTDGWFDEYLYAVVIHKKYVPERLMDLFKEEPVVLPPWDPMFSLVSLAP
jgi:bleomycin hydrolase